MHATEDILAARAGDADAFTRLVRDHAGAVCAVAVAVTGDVRAAEEVAQDVFVTVWQGIGQLRSPESFGTWLRQLARNRAIDLVRARARRREVPEAPDVAAEPADTDAIERERELFAALEDLPADHREVLVLFYREGQSVRQVAEMLELTEATVRKRLSRAREHLREDVAARLGETLRSTAPGMAFVAGVSAAIALAAPGTAQAAVTAAGVKGAAALLGGAALGTTFGLAGVWLGHRAASTGGAAVQADLRRIAVAQCVGIAAASVCFAVLPPLAAVLVGMTGLVTIVAATWIRFGGLQSRAGTVGAVVGSACGLAGAAAGLAGDGIVDLPTALAMCFEMLAFFTVPVVLLVNAPRWLGVPGTAVGTGVVTWITAAPWLYLAPAFTWAATGSEVASLVALAVAAGVAEETSRYLFFRRTRPSGPAGVAAGIGHGGTEALVLGLQALAGALAVTAPAWTYVSFGVSRLVILLVHLGLADVVRRAVAESRPSLWVLAVVLHVALDLVALVLPVVWPGGGLVIGGAALLAAGVASAVVVRRAGAAA